MQVTFAPPITLEDTMTLRFTPLDADFVADIRAGGPDAYGLPAERVVSGGTGTPCRSCLHDVPKGRDMLILAARPFAQLQPYAETGPIFLCADNCTPWDGNGVPPILMTSPDYLLKAYGADDRIIYGTGRVVEQNDLTAYAETLFADGRVVYADVRSARNNCFQTRIIRTP
jgi:hypothetical protein